VHHIRNTELWLEMSDAGNRLWVGLNLADNPIRQTLDARVACIAGESTAASKGPATELTVPGHGWGIFAPADY
jgi:hypothetical protein